MLMVVETRHLAGLGVKAVQFLTHKGTLLYPSTAALSQCKSSSFSHFHIEVRTCLKMQ
jgi:hypothetical protein